MRQLLPIMTAILLVGCATTQDQTPEQAREQRLSRVVSVATFAASTGTRIALLENPEWRDEFELALKSIEFLLETEQHDPQKLRDILRELPINELESERGKIIVDSATILFNTWAREHVQLDRIEGLDRVMTAIANGMRLGLDQARPSRAPQPPKPPGME